MQFHWHASFTDASGCDEVRADPISPGCSKGVAQDLPRLLLGLLFALKRMSPSPGSKRETMNTNPQIESQLDELADLCCQSLNGDSSAITDRSESLLKALLMSGYARTSGTSLQADLEARAKEKCREPAMHRGGALSGISKQLQDKFNDLVRWESRQPEQTSEPKAANFSAATKS
jgi:hypothetical protein